MDHTNYLIDILYLEDMMTIHQKDPGMKMVLTL